MLSIDPSSPFRGGALLGDRIRLTEHFLDPGVFIRSMATRGALGGLAEAALQAALLMDAAGKDDVFLETVGVGQAEVDVIDHADTVVLVLIPGSGDSIQALKAGVMEIPDIIVVNKSDHPLTDTMVREIRGVLSLAPQEGWRVPIVKTEAARGEGVEALAEKLAEHRAHVEAEGTLSERRRRNLMNEVLGIATVRLRRALEATLRDDPEVQALLDEVVARRLDPASAASAVLARGAVDPEPRPRVPTPLSLVQFALQTVRRALESRHAEGVPFVCLRRGLCRALCAPAVAAAANGQLAAVADGRLVTLNPDGSGLRTLSVAGRGRDHRARVVAGRQPARVRAGRARSSDRALERTVLVTLTAGGASNIGWSRTARRSASGAARRLLTHPADRRHPFGAARVDAARRHDRHRLVARPRGFTPVVARPLLLQPLFKTLLLGSPGAAWSPTARRSPTPTATGSPTIKTATGDIAPVTTGPAAGPRWSPDSTARCSIFAGKRIAYGRARRAPQPSLRRRRSRAPPTGSRAAGVTPSCESVTPTALQRDRPDRDHPGRSAGRPAAPAVHRPARRRSRSSSSRRRSTARSGACATRWPPVSRPGHADLPRQQRRARVGALASRSSSSSVHCRRRSQARPVATAVAPRS